MKKVFFRTVSLLLLAATVGCFATACGEQTSGEYAFDDYYEGINLDNQIGKLVDGGNTAYKIVVPVDVTATEMQAATELQYYVEQATGVTLKIVSDEEYVSSDTSAYFSIGETKQRDEANLNTESLNLNGDGFVVKTIGQNIIVDAKTDRGFLYGAYDMIEKMLGVRWFAADETYIPQADVVPVYEMNVVSVPAFEYRTYYSYPESIQGFDESFSAHSRSVSNWIQPSEQYGGEHEMYSRGAGTHNARYFVPAEKYGTQEINGADVVYAEDHEAYPEFYVWTEPPASSGPRMWTRGAYQTINFANGITDDGKLDETMEVSVAKSVIEEMKKDVLANPDAKYFVFEQEDVIDPIVTNDPVNYPDHYELSQKYGRNVGAAVLIRFCNVVANVLQKWADEELNGREINLVTFAYNQTQYAPTVLKNGKYEAMDETVIPADNLYIRLAYSALTYLPLNDQRQSATVREMGDSWSAICKNFFFWGYDLIAEDYIVYNPTWGAAYESVQFLRDIGVAYVMEQGTYNAPNDWQAGIRHYIWTKLLWNPDQDVTLLMNEYITGFYGVAAPYVKAMIEFMDAHYGAYLDALPDIGKVHWAYWTSEMGTAEMLDVKLLDTAVGFLYEAERAIEEDQTLNKATKDKLLKRVAAVKVTPLWMKLKYFSTLCPLASSREKLDLALELNEAATVGGVSRLGEGTSLVGKLRLSYGI